MKPPKRNKSALAKLLEIAEAKVATDIRKRLLSLQNEFDIRDWTEALQTLDPTALDNLLSSVSVLQQDDGGTLLDAYAEILRQSARQALMDWAKNKTQLYLPFGRPEPVQILNAPEFANMEIDVDLPDWAKPVDGVKLRIRLDAADSNAVAFARNRGAELITAIDNQTRQGVRQIIHEAFTQGFSPDKTARRIRSVIGLHPRWAQAVSTFEQKNFTRLIKEGLSESAAEKKAAELAGKYRDSLVRKRALMISRTEIMTASNKGREIGWGALSDAGFIDPVTEKEWLTAPVGSRYGEACDTCAGMRGQRVRFDRAFPNGFFTPPAHPHCRCTVRLVPPSRGLTEVQLEP